MPQKLRRGAFSFGGQSVGLATTEPDVISKLSALLDLPFCERVTDSSLEFLRDRDGFTLIDLVGRKTHYGDLADSIVDLAAIVPYELLPHRSGYVIHAGAVVINDCAHLFIGPGHVGKSTLAHAAWLMGCVVIGDDYLRLDLPTTTVQPVPKPLKLRRFDDSVPEYLGPRDLADRCCIGRRDDSWVLVLGRTLDRMAPLNTPYRIGNIFLLERVDEGVSCEPVEAGVFVESMFAQLITAPRNDLDLIRCFSTMFRRKRVWRLRIGFDASFRAVELMMAMAEPRA